MTILHVDPDSYVPPFEQLRVQIAEKAASGELPPGHRLPPVRRMAADLGLAPNTVARAYRELEQAGLLTGRGARGTFVAGPPAAAPATGPPVTSPAASPGDDLRTAAADFARRAARAGASAHDALDVVRAALAEHLDTSGA